MSGAFKDRGRKAHKEAFCLELVPLATTVLFAEQSLLSHVTSWELQLKKKEERSALCELYRSAFQSCKIIEVTFHLRPPYMLHKEGQRVKEEPSSSSSSFLINI